MELLKGADYIGGKARRELLDVISKRTLRTAYSWATNGRVPLEAVLASSRKALREVSAGMIALISSGRLGFVVRGSRVVATFLRLQSSEFCKPSLLVTTHSNHLGDHLGIRVLAGVTFSGR